MNSAKWQTLKLRKGLLPFLVQQACRLSGTCAVSCYRLCRFAMSTPTKNTCCQHKHDPMIPAETSSKKKLLQRGTPVAGCLVSRSNCRLQIVCWDHESWRIQGLNTPNNLRMAAFFTVFPQTLWMLRKWCQTLIWSLKWIATTFVRWVTQPCFFWNVRCNAKPTWTTGLVEKRRTISSTVGHPQNVIFSQHPVSVNGLKLGRFLVESQVEQTSHQPAEVGIGNWKKIQFGMAFIPILARRKHGIDTTPVTAACVICRGRTMICIGGRGSKGMDAYIYTKKVYIYMYRY